VRLLIAGEKVNVLSASTNHRSVVALLKWQSGS